MGCLGSYYFFYRLHILLTLASTFVSLRLCIRYPFSIYYAIEKPEKLIVMSYVFT